MSDWTKSKVTELKAELKRRGLAQAGLKAELVARLEADDEAAGAPQQTDGREPSASPDDDSRDAPPEPEAVVDATAQEEPSQPAESDSDAPPSAVANEPNEAEENASSIEIENGLAPVTQADPNVGPESMDSGEKTDPARDDPSQQAGSSAPNNPSTTSKKQNQNPSGGLSPAIVVDALKRKRRSASPTPKEELIKRRRAQEASEDIAAQVPAQVAQAQSQDDTGAIDDPMDLATESALEPGVFAKDVMQDAMVIEPEQIPSTHPITSALYVNNLMRPLREPEFRAHLIDLASLPNQEPDDDAIAKFYVDSIRTHAFVVFNSAATAVRVRNRLHGCVWPEESNRKALFVDFVPASRVDSWIDMEEENVRDKKMGQRWEVIYQQGSEGIEAQLQSNFVTSAASARPAGRTQSNNVVVEGAPTGPRSQRAPQPPPRSSRHAHQDPAGPWDSRPGPPSSRPHRPSVAEGAGEPTMTQPVIFFQAVPTMMARRRLQDMRSYYTRDTLRVLGREINRYSFQDDDRFIDRGREVFEGIRPPHRQQAIDRELRMGNGGGPGSARRDSRTWRRTTRGQQRPGHGHVRVWMS
ncbi:hypothetical protein HIM_02656 [Hirsutella minnesotensis 3608]|nr:hypothetical protein HIM_02656 [Hirsutella minnesotensis 3608]